MQYYQINNWNGIFETSESRKYKALNWVAMPNSMDGEGYNMVKSLKQAPEIFCAWCLIVEVASRCPQRGILVDKDGNPYNPKRLAMKTGYPESIFVLALKELTKPEIGWIKEYLPVSAVTTEDTRKISRHTPDTDITDITEHNRHILGQKKSLTFDFLNKITELNYPDRKKEYFEILTRVPGLCLKIDPLNITDETPKIIGAVFYTLHHFSKLRKKYPKLDWVELVNSKFKRGFTVWAVAGMLWKISKLKEPPHDFYAYCESLGKDQKVITDVWEIEIWPVVKADKIKLPA